MHPTDVFVRRPVLATVVSLVIVILGLRAFAELDLREYPESSVAVVTITTPYVGASADVVRGFITTPLEQVIAGVDGIDYLESSSVQGASTIQAHLRLNYDPNDAVADILTKVNQVRNQLPDQSDEPQISVAVGQTAAAMYLAFSSDSLSASQVTDYLTRVVRPQLQSIPGIQRAQILGGRSFAMRVWLDPIRMAALGVAPRDVRSALERNNVLAATGDTENSLLSITLTAETELHRAEDFRRLVVREDGGAIIRLGDVADVVLGAESYDSSVVYNGTPATFVSLEVVPTANPLRVIGDVRQLFPDIRDQLPEALEGSIVYDATEFIEIAIEEVVWSLALAVGIVVAVIFLSLGTIRSALVPAVTIPLAMIGTGAIMLALGFSVNLLTLLALVLAIGIIVDDAIVVVESVSRHIESGARPMDAALRAGRELLGPIIAMNVVLVAIFAPVGLQGGLTGNLFTEFAFTVAGAGLLSGVIGLTLSPMMAGKLLRRSELDGRFARFVRRAFAGTTNAYGAALRRALDLRGAVLAFGALTLVASYFLYAFASKELAPEEDQGFLIILSTADPNVSLERLESFTSRFQNVVLDLPAVRRYFAVNGAAPGGGGATANQAFAGAQLRPWDERTSSQADVQIELQRRLGAIGGLQSVVFGPPTLPGAGGGLPIQFVVGSTGDSRIVYEVAETMLARARASGLFAFVESDLHFDRLQMRIIVDRDKAADLGIDMRELATDLATMLSEGRVNFFSLQDRSYRVIPRVDDRYRRRPEQLLDFQVRTESGALVPAATIVSLEPAVVPRQLKRFQQLNAAVLSGVPAPGVTLGEALGFLQREAEAVFPQGFRAEYAGPARQFVEESGALVTAFFLAVVLIYLVLAAQFESFRDPLIMLVTVPMSTVGALIFLHIAGATINIYTQIGLIALIGTISKHGILIVEFANRLQRERGLDRRAAVEEAARIRLRPILMTTGATAAGLVPLLIATGPGSAARFAIGLIPAAGMLLGTLFTLFVLPAAYSVMAKPHRERSEAASAEIADAEPG